MHGYFVCQPLGAQALKGLTQPLQVYQVLQESGAQTRLDVVTPRGLTPLVGRDEEVGLLQRRWDQTTTGIGQVVLLSGEAGIGKSRLAQVLKEHMSSASYTRIEWRGSPYHQQSALYPVIDHLQFPFRILFPRFRRGFRVAPSRSACLASPSSYRNRPRGALGSFFSTPVCPMINLERVYERTPSKGHCPMLRQVIAPCASLSVSPGLGRLVIHSGGRCSTSPGRSTPRDSAGGWASAGGQVGDGPPLCAPSRWQIWSSS